MAGGKRKHAGGDYPASLRKWGAKFGGATMATTSGALARARLNVRTGGFRGIELKYFDSSRPSGDLVASTAMASAELDPSTLNTLFCPVPGTGPTNRIGRNVTIKSIVVQGMTYLVRNLYETAPTSAPMVFIALVQDKQTNAAQLNSEDVFTNPGNVAVTGPSCFRDLEYSQRFTVLASTKVCIPVPSVSYDGTNMEITGTTTPFKLTWKGSQVVQFNTTGGGTVADITGNSYHIIATASDITGAPQLVYNCRCRFLDS